MAIWVISVAVYCWLIIAFLHEAILLIMWFTKGKYIYWDRQHSIEHILYSLSYWIGNAMLVYWLFSHLWIEHGFEKHIVEERLWYVLIILSISWLSLLMHIRKERVSENIF